VRWNVEPRRVDVAVSRAFASEKLALAVEVIRLKVGFTKVVDGRPDADHITITVLVDHHSASYQGTYFDRWRARYSQMCRRGDTPAVASQIRPMRSTGMAV
jgi:hypothetical protein